MYITALNSLAIKKDLQERGIRRVYEGEGKATIIYMDNIYKFKSELGERKLYKNYHRDNDDYEELGFNISRHGYVFNVRIIADEEDIKYVEGGD